MIYMDNAATMKPLPCAVEKFVKLSQYNYANPNSPHGFGQEAKEILEQSRKTIADCLGADTEEIYFTSGATESCRIGLKTLSKYCEVISVTPSSHSALRTTKQFIKKAKGNAYEFGVAEYLGNNETGDFLIGTPHSLNNGLSFLDITASCGHIPIDLHKLGVDYAAAGAHKFGGLPGVGILYAKKTAPKPIFLDGSKKRDGTPPVSLIAAMAEALECQAALMEENIKKTTELRDYLEYRILSEIPAARVNEKSPHRLPHITNISFDGIESTALVALLSENEIYVSTGSACESDKNEPSRILTAMGFDMERAASAVRFSLSHENMAAECDIVVEHLKKLVSFLRKC